MKIPHVLTVILAIMAIGPAIAGDSIDHKKLAAPAPTQYRAEGCGMLYSAEDAKKYKFVCPMDHSKLVAVVAKPATTTTDQPTQYRAACGMVYSADDAKKNNYVCPMDHSTLVAVALEQPKTPAPQPSPSCCTPQYQPAASSGTSSTSEPDQSKGSH